LEPVVLIDPVLKGSVELVEPMEEFILRRQVAPILGLRFSRNTVHLSFFVVYFLSGERRYSNGTNSGGITGRNADYRSH